MKLYLNIGFLFLLSIFGTQANAQRPSIDFILPCGPTTVNKLIPLKQNTILPLAMGKNKSDTIPLVNNDEFCLEGKDYSLVQYLKDHPLLKIEISAHSRIATVAQTKIWADNIKNYLVENGVEMYRIETVGKGKSELLILESNYQKTNNIQEKNKMDIINTRIEIKILADQFKPWFGISDQKFYKGQFLDPNLTAQLNRQYNALFKVIPNQNINAETETRRDTAYRILNVISIFLQTHQDICIEIGISVSANKDQLVLQKQLEANAKQIQKYLVEKGVRLNQTSTKAYILSMAIQQKEEFTFRITKGN